MKIRARKQATTPHHDLAAAGPTSLVDAGSEASYRHYLPAAIGIPKSQVRGMRLEIELVLTNAARGAEVVLAHEAELASVLPAVSPAVIRSLPELGSAIVYANGVIRRYQPTPKDVKSMLVRGRALRRQMLACADALAASGLVSAAAVAKIHKGRGARDTAADLVDLGQLFATASPEARAKLTVSDDEIAEASKLGEQLQTVVRPRRAKRLPDAGLAAAVDIRDRLWTLFDQTWERHVWLAGAYLFGRDVDRNLPTLGARVSKRDRAPMPPAPAPAPTPAPVAA